MKKTFAILFAVLLTVTACSKFEAAPPIPETAVDRAEALDEQHKKDEFARDTQRFSTEAPRPYDVLEYSLKGQFDWSRATLDANVTITLKRDPSLRSIELDSLVAQISKVALTSGETLPFTVDLAKHKLTVELPSTLTDETVSLRIDYQVLGGSQADERRRNLNMILPRSGDPVQTRVLYTRSEPTGAHAWMPCNDRPADGALFSVEITMPAHERMIANGRLLKDDVVGQERTMSYRTDNPQPTYLMAFAQGDFVSATLMHGSLPVSVWARRGVQVEWDAILNETVREIALFEKLLTPYPYEKYVIVLVPEFGGGMEHASITFNEETRSSQPLRGDFGLMAHELGHHWFGDMITVTHWDDLWVKEGMATLLSTEAMRTFDDQKQTGFMMGDFFNIKNGDAIRDPALAPSAKYTSGPYGRAAWFYTQIRAAIGETAFWGALRGLLLAHRYGSVSSDDVLEAFRPALGEARYNKALASLGSHEMPQVHVVVAGDVLTLSLDDVEDTLLAPLEITEMGVSGQQTRHSLLVSGSVSFQKQPGVLVSIDPRDVHPMLTTWVRGPDAKAESKTLGEAMAKLTIPADAAEMALFPALSPGNQVAAISTPELWKISPAEFVGLHSNIGSVFSRFASLSLACARSRLAQDAIEKAEWTDILGDVMLTPDLLGMVGPTGPLLNANCRDVVPESLISRLSMVGKQATSSKIGDAELAYLSFLPVDGVMKTWGALAENATSLRARMIALDTIATRMATPNEKGRGEDSAKAMFRRMLDGSDIQGVLTSAMVGAVNTKDQLAIPSLASVTTRRSVQTWVSQTAACSAWAIAAGDQLIWDTYLMQVGSTSILPNIVRETVENPAKKCQ